MAGDQLGFHLQKYWIIHGVSLSEEKSAIPQATTREKDTRRAGLSRLRKLKDSTWVVRENKVCLIQGN